jgi:hypothetical protein
MSLEFGVERRVFAQSAPTMGKEQRDGHRKKVERLAYRIDPIPNESKHLRYAWNPVQIVPV